MKHNSLFSANGFHNPLASTTIKSSFLTAIFKPLLMLFLLVMGSSVVWADDYALNNPIGADGYYIVKWDCANSTWASSNSMQIGETFTFAIDITGNSYLLGIVNSGHTIAFAHYAGDGYEREYTADCFRLKQISGNIYGATYNFKKDKPDWDTQKIWARFWDGNNWDYPGKEIHSPTKNGLFKWATNTGATSPDFTPEQLAADGGMPGGRQRNGYAAPCACEETGGAPAGDTFQGGEVFYMKQNTIDKNGNNCNFLEYGRCDFNLYSVDGNNWHSPGLHAEVIPNTDPVMLKFTVPAEHAGTEWGQVKVKQLEPNGTGHSETKKGAIPKDGKNYLINGNTMEWGTYVEPVPYTGNLYLIGGACTGQNWNLGNAVLLDNDGHGIYTITRQINAVTGDNSDGFKFLESANWDPQWRPTPENATVSLNDGGKAQDVAPGQTNIVIKKNPGSPDTKWHLTTSGTYTITINLSDRDNGKMSIEAATPAEPDYQPWSGDSYRDWYLTGDFTNPNEFDGWTMNPSAYKFAADGDNHQKVSITLDPNDASIFHDNSGHKLTRFEIIRQGTWDNPRINKPQFHAATSNCSLQTDWKDAGSNRMSLELTAKSVIEFDIWRWGTAPGSADRKVTVTITPVPQVTVTFMANGETFATQTFDKGGKASIPTGTPARSGHNFNGWDWDFNTTVNENTTIDATWVYKAISSVVLNESTHMTWVGNSDFALTPTLTPSDAIAKSVAWSSNTTGVATVSDGTVHAVTAGEARITCTVTDQFDQQVSAYCDVTVAACEMATENLYSMTVTGYNSKIGDYADLSGLWNESSDNDGPATLEKVKIEYKDNSGNNQAPIAVDADHRVKAISGLSDESDYWYRIPTGETIINGSHTYDVYYLKNVKTGEFIYVDKSTEYGHNGDYWHYWATRTSATNAKTDIYKWFTAVNYNQNDHRNVIVCKDGFNNTYSGDGARTNIGLYRTDVNSSVEWSDPLIKCGQKVMNGYQNAHTGMVPSVSSENIPNPNYKTSQMNGSYYRIKENATVRANLGGALVPGAVITVRLYADAATTVKLQKTDGTEIETINLSADAEREYTYTGSALVGEEAFVIKASDNHAGIASIVVTRTYAIRLAQLIEETEIGGTLTLTCDYATDNAVIDKAITINGGGHTIGDLKIENTGDLTLGSGLIVRDFTICAKAGNTSTPAASGQVRNATNLTVNGNAYFLYTVDPNGHVQYGWYDFTVPFPVNVMSGIAGIDEYSVLNEDFVNERDYAIMEYLGERKALGQYPYQKFRGEMQPNQLYSITLDNRDNYNTVRFRKTADGELVADDNVTLHAYAGSGVFDNLNGVGNGTLHHADAGNLSVGFVQVYQSGDKTFLTVDKTQYSFVVGTAFMVQETGTMTLNQANPEHNLLAPARQASAPATAIQIAREGQPFSDQLFISASETGGQAYTPGTDLAKAGDLGSANVPQIWTTAYNNPLCVHEAQLINGEASYNLSIYAPAADTYTLTSQNIPADYSLYLTQNGTMLTELNGTYTFDLSKGITTEYGLLLVETYKTPTGIEESGIRSQESGIRKILHNGVLYILHNGKIYNAQGGKVCDL